MEKTGTYNPHSALLQGAVNNNGDKKQVASVNLGTFFVAKNGFGYVLLSKEYHKIDIVNISYSPNKDQWEDGILDNATATIQTTTKIENLFKHEDNAVYIIKYNNMVMACKGSNQVSNVVEMVFYNCDVLNARGSNFLIIEEDEAELRLNSSSIPLWLDFSDTLNIPVFPAYLSNFNIKEPYLSVEILSSRDLSSVRNHKDNELIQHKEDTVRLHLMNSDVNISQEILYKIQNAEIEHECGFGCTQWGAWRQDLGQRQTAFGIMINKKVVDIKVNYYLETHTELVIVKLKRVLAMINNFEYILFEGDK